MFREDFRENEDCRLVEEGWTDSDRELGKNREQQCMREVTTGMAYMRSQNL